MRQKLYQAMCKAKTAFIFSSFLEKPFANRVKRRSCILLTVRFCRSTYDAEILCAFGCPVTEIRTAFTISEGLTLAVGFIDSCSPLKVEGRIPKFMRTVKIAVLKLACRPVATHHLGT